MKKFLVLAITLGALSLPAHADHHKGDWFTKVDADGNGTISRTEFLDHKGKKFDKMDADGNGEVTMDEKKAYKSEKKGEKKDCPCKECDCHEHHDH